jgi:hypothetical protein
MQELAIPAEASGKLQAKAKKRRVPAKVKHAVDLLFSGECKTQKAAAERVGLTREYLNRALAQDHVNDYFTHKAKLEMRAALPIAIAVKAGLLGAVSEKVQSEVASEIMALGGIIAPKATEHANVNVAVSVGYIVDWRGTEQQPASIDITPGRGVSGEVSETTG